MTLSLSALHSKKDRQLSGIYKPDEKDTHTVGFFYFSELLFQLFYLYSSIAKSSTSSFPKIHLIWSKSESVISLEIREGSKSIVKNVSV